MRTLELIVHAAECQRCTGLSSYGSNPDHAALVARNSGWLEIDGKTLCWQCKEEVQDEKRRRRVVVGLDTIVAAVVNKESGDAN